MIIIIVSVSQTHLHHAARPHVYFYMKVWRMEAERRRHRDSQRCSRDATLREQTIRDQRHTAERPRGAVMETLVEWLMLQCDESQITVLLRTYRVRVWESTGKIRTPPRWSQVLLPSFDSLRSGIATSSVHVGPKHPPADGCEFFKRLHQYVEIRLMVRESSMNIIEFCESHGACYQNNIYIQILAKWGHFGRFSEV